MNMPYLAAFAVAAIIALAALEYLLDEEESRGARSDRWLPNAFFGVVNTSLGAFVPLSSLSMAVIADNRGWGILGDGQAGWVHLVAAFLLVSAAQYACHRALHTLPWLWRIHQVHHSDQTLDATTSLRFHPLEAMVYALCYGCVILAFGPDPWAVFVVHLSSLCFGTITHTDLKVPYHLNRCLNLFIVTPNYHQLHHSNRPDHWHSNYSEMFPFWDRLFGTMSQNAQDESISYGLGTASRQETVNLDHLIMLRDMSDEGGRSDP